MPQSTLAVELYTLRDFLKTPADIVATLKKVKKIGYNAVELAGLGKIDAKELANVLTGEGLTCCATHTPIEVLQKEPQRVIDEHRLWNCSYTAVPWFIGKTLAEYSGLADQINSAATQLESANIRLGYHNHSHELVRIDGRTPLSLLIEKLMPRCWFEVDTYWIVHGGGDPVQWISNLKGRIPCVHLKDMAIDADGKHQMAEVGEGNMNWTGILAACQQAGTQWYVVEQDTCPRDPFDCIATSLRNLRRLGWN